LPRKAAEFSLLEHSVPSEWSLPQIAFGWPWHFNQSNFSNISVLSRSG
jgi:hypothetical protein